MFVVVINQSWHAFAWKKNALTMRGQRMSRAPQKAIVHHTFHVQTNESLVVASLHLQQRNDDNEMKRETRKKNTKILYRNSQPDQHAWKCELCGFNVSTGPFIIIFDMHLKTEIFQWAFIICCTHSDTLRLYYIIRTHVLWSESEVWVADASDSKKDLMTVNCVNDVIG